MKTNDILTSKILAAAIEHAPTDFSGQIAAMLAVLHDELLTHLTHMQTDTEQGQVYARPYQLAERWGYTDGGLRRFLYAAEQSGKVRIIQPADIDGTPGQKMYHIGDLERFFALQK